MQTPSLKRAVALLADLDALLAECRPLIPASRRAEFDLKAEGVRRVAAEMTGTAGGEDGSRDGEWMSLAAFCKRESILPSTAANAIRRGTFPLDQLRITGRGAYEVPRDCAWRPNPRGWKPGRTRRTDAEGRITDDGSGD
jgi:hypothetical protein